MSPLVAMSPEEIERDKKLENLRTTTLLNMLSGQSGNILFSDVFNLYKKNKGSFFNGDSYDIPDRLTCDKPLLLEEMPIAFYDCWLTEEMIQTNHIDPLEEFSKIYIRCRSNESTWSWIAPIKILYFVDDDVWPELKAYNRNLNGNINQHLQNIIKQNPRLSIREYIFEVCRFINENIFYVTVKSQNIQVPFINDLSQSHQAVLSVYSCSTNNPYRELNKFRGCTPTSIKCFYQYYRDVTCPFEDKIHSIWYNKDVLYSNRKSWTESLFLITEKGYYVPIKEILDSGKEGYSDNVNLTQPYNLFLSGALRMVFCYAFTEELTNTLHYLHQLLVDSKISVFKNKTDSKFSFVYSRPYYRWI